MRPHLYECSPVKSTANRHGRRLTSRAKAMTPQRCLSLSGNVERDKSKAVDGVLELVLPKAASAQVRQIPVHA